MSRDRQAQWAHRLKRLQVLREQFTWAHRYDRAYKAYQVVQRLYDRWADEVFAAARPK